MGQIGSGPLKTGGQNLQKA